jgi:hypothetical protein
VSRTRLTLMSVVAAFAVTTISAASASAAGQWWVSGAKFSGTEEITGHLKAGTKAILKSKLPGGEEIESESPKISGRKGDLFGNNKGLAEEITYLETTMLKPLGCSTESSLVIKPVVAELEVEGAKVFDLLTPKSGTEFATGTITGCAAEGKYKATGQTRCEVQKPEEEAEDKLCVFSSATVGAVGLKFGTEPGTFTAELEISLVKKQKWSAKKE